MKTLFILNDPPYGAERTYNGLRLANSLAKRPGEDVRVFLMGDAASAAKAGQQTANGFYNLERMLAGAARAGVSIGICGTCMDARGIGAAELVAGATRSSLDELTDWTQWSDRVLVF